jgi:glucose-6-phosphate-specific signal transduction histidine kinase
MNAVKNIFMLLLAWIVLLAPVIILGWMGASLFGWLGLIIGVLLGGAIFVASMNKVIQQDAEEGFEDTPTQ